MPNDWPKFSIHYRGPSGKTLHRIEISNPKKDSSKVISLSFDGKSLPPEEGIARWKFLDDGKEHAVAVTLGPA
ncbi:MAG: hypothetical protein HC767_06220 [Akkermansiaceae bacterium]|nr:hypothetical protein [Akkermansiaceae bacterium]